MVKCQAAQSQTVRPLAGQISHLKKEVKHADVKTLNTCSRPGADLAHAKRRVSGEGAGLSPVARHTWRNW